MIKKNQFKKKKINQNEPNKLGLISKTPNSWDPTPGFNKKIAKKHNNKKNMDKIWYKIKLRRIKLIKNQFTEVQ